MRGQINVGYVSERNLDDAGRSMGSVILKWPTLNKINWEVGLLVLDLAAPTTTIVKKWAEYC